MRRTTLVLTALTALTLTLAGCGGTSPAPASDTQPKCSDSAKPGETPKCADALPAAPDKPKDPPANQGITHNKVNYTVIVPDRAPDEVLDTWEKLKDGVAQEVVVVSGETFAIITAGEKPSGGYSVEIISVGEANGKLRVTYAVTAPKPGSMTTAAITYPSAIVQFQNPANLPVEFAQAQP